MSRECSCQDRLLDAAGNTTAAIGKGFAIGSAALVSLALFGAFSTKVGWLEQYGVNMLRPVTFSFLIIGAMLPYVVFVFENVITFLFELRHSNYKNMSRIAHFDFLMTQKTRTPTLEHRYIFTAMTMKSVGKAAAAMVEEVQRQFTENPDLLDESKGMKPDYATCIDISTKALREMVLPDFSSCSPRFYRWPSVWRLCADSERCSRVQCTDGHLSIQYRRCLG